MDMAVRAYLPPFTSPNIEIAPTLPSRLTPRGNVTNRIDAFHTYILHHIATNLVKWTIWLWIEKKKRGGLALSVDMDHLLSK